MIQITNWSSFQSYKDRKPPWIRLHKSLLDNFEYHSMSVQARALLPMLWLLASEDENPVTGTIRFGYEKIAFRLREKESVVKAACIELSKCGFISIDNQQVTESLRNCHETVPSETETETETEIEGEITSPTAPKRQHPKEATTFVGWFHEHCPSLPTVKEITDKRNASIKARLSERKDFDWISFLKRVENSDFLTNRSGENRNGWKADIDFILKKDSVVKIIEGKYDNKTGSVQRVQPRFVGE